jgi:molybdopterin-containing oxidoreductase family iron-sulfur binding subunit
MHWLRIDRYYSSESTFEGDNEKSIAGLGDSHHNEMEKLEIIHKFLQPVMCQHCNPLLVRLFVQ